MKVAVSPHTGDETGGTTTSRECAPDVAVEFVIDVDSELPFARDSCPSGTSAGRSARSPSFRELRGANSQSAC